MSAPAYPPPDATREQVNEWRLCKGLEALPPKGARKYICETCGYRPVHWKNRQPMAECKVCRGGAS